MLNKTNLQGITIITAPGTLQEFFCYTDGVPFPTVTWKKDGNIFDVTNMSGVEVTERNQKVTIRRVLERDAGFYQCVVQNRGGQVTANATLDILDGEFSFLFNEISMNYLILQLNEQLICLPHSVCNHSFVILNRADVTGCSKQLAQLA